MILLERNAEKHGEMAPSSFIIIICIPYCSVCTWISGSFWFLLLSWTEVWT